MLSRCCRNGTIRNRRTPSSWSPAAGLLHPHGSGSCAALGDTGSREGEQPHVRTVHSTRSPPSSPGREPLRHGINGFAYRPRVLADLERLDDLDHTEHDEPHAGNQHKHDDRIERPSKNNEAGDHGDDAKDDRPTTPWQIRIADRCGDGRNTLKDKPDFLSTATAEESRTHRRSGGKTGLPVPLTALR